MELLSTNIALRKPAFQSSTSRWSSNKAAESDAAIATSGDTESPLCFHTDYEFCPWWQVDLLEQFVIEKVLIFNRFEFQERLKTFCVMISLTGRENSWQLMHNKQDSVVFGQNSNTPYLVHPKLPYFGRFVRIQLSENGFLHFRQCQVFGRSPRRGEPAHFRQQMLGRLKKGQKDAEQLKIKHFSGKRGYIAPIGAQKVFVDTDAYSPVVVQSLSNNTYELRERKIISAVLSADDRVLEVGTAIGAVTMLIAGIVGPLQVVTYDANPAMVSDARANFELNHLRGISANLGVMRNRHQWRNAETEVSFYISRDFWASRLNASKGAKDICKTVSVPLVCLEEAIEKHKANVLVCDIEGGEAELLLNADLSLVRLIVVETHYWVSGRSGVDMMIRSLVERGFNLNLDYTGGHIVVFDRNDTSA